MSFTWHGERLDYFDHPYNDTRLNERAVEIAVAQRFLADKHGDGLEVGNVLSHYMPCSHRIVDLLEESPGVENRDVFEIGGSYDWIVSISTIEHVQWDTEPRNPTGALMAVDYLRALLARDGRMLVTVPLGYHAPLDEAIKTGVLEPARDCVFIRNGNRWEQRTRKTWRSYGATTPWADAMWIGEW